MNFITIAEKEFKRIINLEMITYFVCENGTTKISLADRQTIYINKDITPALRKLINAHGMNATIDI